MYNNIIPENNDTTTGNKIPVHANSLAVLDKQSMQVVMCVPETLRGLTTDDDDDDDDNYNDDHDYLTFPLN